MKLKFVAVAALAAFTSVGALAVNLGTIPPTASFAKTVAAGSFLDTWTFNLTTPSIVAASATNVAISFGAINVGAIGSFAALLNGVPLGLSSFASTNNGVTVHTQVLSGSTNLPAGMFNLTVSGVAAAGGASYGGNIVAVPVPEPETLAMMLAGLGAVGFLARRRQNV